ncbi:helix-turn-helix domain-containing protein [Gehongia tenuis]|uniref:Helix-turn-helix transcriptional regulator n=1 Tax=Gehongia tenuis TaxID=2763655 RepID=A0A926HRJ0_9FIRM|nr:cupin domain-containing protein [Gehongia tenuis]MBC8532371.1 helix-turn-helix transcriptional regulator [Gehongia tenuis]
MPDQILQIATRIKDLREIEDVSVETLAQEFNIDPETYRQYESGQIDIPISFLIQVAQRFKVEFTTLMTGDEPKLHIYNVCRAGKGVRVERRKAYDYKNLAYHMIRKKCEPFFVTVDPNKVKAFSLDSHPGQEFDYVLEGTMKIRIHNKELVLNAGDSIYFDSSYKHGMMAVGDKMVKFLAIVL